MLHTDLSVITDVQTQYSYGPAAHMVAMPSTARKIAGLFFFICFSYCMFMNVGPSGEPVHVRFSLGTQPG